MLSFSEYAEYAGVVVRRVAKLYRDFFGPCHLPLLASYVIGMQIQPEAPRFSPARYRPVF